MAKRRCYVLRRNKTAPECVEPTVEIAKTYLAQVVQYSYDSRDYANRCSKIAGLVKGSGATASVAKRRTALSSHRSHGNLCIANSFVMSCNPISFQGLKTPVGARAV